MMPTRKHLVWLLLAIIPAMGQQCGEERFVPDCTGAYLGGLSLRPASLSWLPAPGPDSLRFVNSNGFRAVLDRVRTPALPDSVTLLATQRNMLDYNESILTPGGRVCQPHFRARRVGWYYQGRNINLSLRLNLLKYLEPGLGTSATPLTRAVADTLPDVMALAFNQQHYAEFPVVRAPYRRPRTTRLGTAVYLDSVRLAGRTFFGVYQFSHQSYSPGLQPLFYYFRPGQGLVGFIYSNSEQWALL